MLKNIKALCKHALTHHALKDLQNAAEEIKHLIAIEGTQKDAVRELAKENVLIKAR